MNSIKRYIVLTIALLPILFAGCDDFFDVNIDPNNPTTMSVDNILPHAQISVAYSVAPGARGSSYSGIGDLLHVYVHQVTVREGTDKYGATGGSWTIGTSWRNSYTDAIVNLEDIIRQGNELGYARYVGIAKILKAYIYSVLVDVYGSVPYTEAITNLYPVFDEGREIYNSLFALIDEAIGDLTDDEAPNALVPRNDDLIYGGNVEKWIKAANTLKFKMLNQVRLVQNVGTDIQTLLAGELIEDFDESFMFRFNSTRTPDTRNPLYGDTYEATQKTKHMSPWFYEILMGYNPNIFTGNRDPRIPYYFYNQATRTVSIPNPSEYRNGGFVSIYFGSDGSDKGHSRDRHVTVFGIYPAGGLYDDGGAVGVAAGSSTGAAPFRMITYADRLFIEAELIQAGVIPGDARDKLESAIRAAFEQVDGVVNLVNNSQTVPVLATSAAADTYIDDVMDEFDAAGDDKKMEIIITQKWISNFGNGFESYNDHRRTGYPILFDPNDQQMAPNGSATPRSDDGGDPDRETGISPPVPVSCAVGYPLSLPWPTTEMDRNPNAPAQKVNLPTQKVFWMN